MTLLYLARITGTAIRSLGCGLPSRSSVQLKYLLIARGRPMCQHDGYFAFGMSATSKNFTKIGWWCRIWTCSKWFRVIRATNYTNHQFGAPQKPLEHLFAHTTFCGANQIGGATGNRTPISTLPELCPTVERWPQNQGVVPLGWIHCTLRCWISGIFTSASWCGIPQKPLGYLRTRLTFHRTRQIGVAVRFYSQPLSRLVKLYAAPSVIFFGLP